MDAEDRDSPAQVRLLNEDLPVETARAKERRIEVLEPVRRGHHDHLVARAEPVELDEQLVQCLILLAVVRVTASSPADGVELVDEDDRRRVLPRLFEQLADPRRAEAGVHLHERRSALREEARTRGIGDRLGGKRLAGSGRPVQEDPLRHARAQTLEALRVAQEVDDLLKLRLRLVEARDVGPADRRGRPGRDLRRLDARHHLERPPEEIDDDAHQREEHDRKPCQREVLDRRGNAGGRHREHHRQGVPATKADRARARDRRRAPPRRPRAAPRTARPSPPDAGTRGPAARARERQGAPSFAASIRRSRWRPPPIQRLRADTGGGPEPDGRPRGKHVPDRARGEHRADEVRAAPLVLAWARLAVLVAPDRDVLGAVVGGKLAAPQRQNRRPERDDTADELLRDVAEPRPAHAARHDRRPEHRREDARPLRTAASPRGAGA